jgi:PAS domain S-box-containing protein
MAFQVTPNLFFLICTAILSYILLVYLYFLHKTRENLALILLMTASLAWSLGGIMEASVVEDHLKVFWHKISQTGINTVPLLWLAVVLRLGDRKDWVTWKKFLPLAFLPLAASALLWTNEIHWLFWRGVETGLPGRSVTVINGPAGQASMLYNFALALACIILLSMKLRRVKGGLAGKYAILIFCTTVPLLMRLRLVLPIDGPLAHGAASLGFFTASIFFVFAMFYYRMFGLVSIPAQSIITGMQDGILVLDEENRVQQANSSAERILGLANSEVLNQDVSSLFDAFQTATGGRIDIVNSSFQKVQRVDEDRIQHFELHWSKIHEQHRHPAGWLLTIRDITSQVQAEQDSLESQKTIKQSEEKFRSLVENISEAIFFVDRQGIISYISPAIEQILGYKAEQMIGQPYQSFIYPDDLAELNTRPLQMLDERQDRLEFRMVNRNKKVRYVRIYPHGIRQDGVIIGIQGVITDITERKQVEDSLERRASQLATLNYIGERIAEFIELDSLFNSAVQLIQKNFGYYHVGIFTPDLRWNMLIMRANSGAFSELFPENHRLMLGQGMVGWAAENKTVLLANDVRLEYRYANLYPDKIPTRAELAVPILAGDELMGVLDIQSPLVNAFDENDVRVMKTIADQIAVAMEKARLYEEVRLQLKERERREHLLRIQRDLLIQLSPAKSLEETLQVALEAFCTELRANQVSISLLEGESAISAKTNNLGYPINPGLQMSVSERNLPGWVARNGKPVLIKNARSDPRRPDVFPGTLSVLSVPLFSSDRVIGVISLESSVANAFSHEDQHLLTTLSNSLVMLIERARLFEEVVTARAELEQRADELQEANNSLLEMDRLKTQFLANMSHELRTPLNSIIGFSEVLIDELIGKLNGDQKDAAEDILESGRHLLKLINDLLDFSKINAGHMHLEPAMFDAAGLFDELHRSILPMAQKKKQTLVFHVQRPGIQVNADRLRIKQVLMNLISNAVKFTGEGGCISVSCKLNDQQQALFTVSDNGIGIRQEDQQIIFEEFRQVDGSMTREVPGTGLGLAISKKIIENHQGRIWVESEPGKGSAFHIYLPPHLRPIAE